MQTTLLGLGIAIILALVAALVGPLLIDWGTHRSLFEAEASRLLGVDVQVKGPIEARLLPTPSLTLHDIAIGRGKNAIGARLLGFEFALAPLLRGRWQASEVHLAGPQLSLGLDASGHVIAPKLAVAFSPDNLSIDRLNIEDGTLTLSDAANGARATLKSFWFNGDARSLLGPFKGEGAATVGGELYPFRLVAGRYGDDGAVKLKVNVDPVDRPLSIGLDGTLALSGAAPKFDGTLNLTRPVGISAAGRAKDGDTVNQPWHLSGKLKASAAKALMEQFEFQYGSNEQGLKLTGVADFTFGKKPHFDGVVSGRDIDLDRALIAADGSRPPPAAALRKIAQLIGGAFRPAIPIAIGVGIDQFTFGGSHLANLRGDISTDAGGWNLDRFEFRAPGFTQVRLSGHLEVRDDGVRFTGPAEIDAGDPKLLAAWLEGRKGTAQGEPKPLKLRGDVSFGSDRIAIEHLTAAFDGKTVSGRTAYDFAAPGTPTKLDVALDAPELDIDAALAFGRALLAGSAIERPHDMTIAADIGRATMAGLVARDASARVSVDGGGVRIDKLAIADLGGGSFSASGRIDTGGRAPHGSLAVDFESGETAAVAALADKFAPKAVKPIADLFTRVNHAKLHATLTLSEDKQPTVTVAQAAVTGALDAMSLDLQARMSGDWDHLSAADMRIEGSVKAPQGAALIKLIGLDRYVASSQGDGELKLQVAGRGDRDQHIDVRLRAGALSVQSVGRGRISFDNGLQMTSMLDIAGADLSALRPTAIAGSGEPLPFSAHSRLVVAGHAISVDNFTARLGGSSVHGGVAIDGDKVAGSIEADTIEAAPLIAAAIGMPGAAAAGTDAAWVWSSEPFSGGIFGDYSGDIALKAGRVDLLPRLTAREFRATLRFDNRKFAIGDITGAVAGGKLAGTMSFGSSADGVTAQAKLSLARVDAANVLSSGARPPVTGALDLSADVEGAGLSPIALIGSLQGSGKIALADAQFAGLDPRAFDAVTRAVDQGLPIDNARIADAVRKALDSGDLAVKTIDGTLAVSAGQIRLSKAAADAKDAALSMSANLDLTDGSIDARLVLSGSGRESGERPDIFLALKGPVSDPARSVDVTALTGWLTLRSVENQARQLHELEQAQQREKAQQQAKPPPRPKRDIAPVLPPPLDIKPAPQPRRLVPELSVDGSHN